MADILSLAARITGDTSNFRLTPAERALANLGKEVDAVAAQFDRFATDSTAAVEAQTRFAAQSQALSDSLKAGTINAQEFASQFNALASAAEAEADALERAARITEANLSTTERFGRAQTTLRAQLDAGRITQETYNRAIEAAAKGMTSAERAAAGLAAQTKAIEGAGAGSALKLNELSGIAAVLPGPLGNIAGRISGIVSASEGLSRIFAGGLSSGLSSLTTSLAAFINPVTLAVGAVVALGAGAVAVVSGLRSLEDRVESLSNLANKLGISFEFVQVLEEAGKRTGVSIESVSSAMTRLQLALAGADEESKKATDALARLGLSFTDLQPLNQDEQIRLIAERIASIEDPALRTAAAVALFGKSGTDLVPLFENLEKAADDMERVGAAISEADRQRYAAFGDSVDRLGTSFTGLNQITLTPFLDTTIQATDSLALFAESGVGLTDEVLPAFEFIGNFVGESVSVFAELGSVMLEVTEGVFSIVNAFGIFEGATAVAGGLGTVFRGIIDALGRIVEIVKTGIGLAVERFGDWLASSESIVSIGETLYGVFETIAGIVSSVFSGIANTVDYILTAAETLLGIERKTKESTSKTLGDVTAATAELTKEQQKAIDASQQIIDKSLEQLRIENEFGGDSGRFKAAENLLVLQQEIERVEKAIAAAREAGNQAEASTLAARLATLDQVASREQDIASGAKKAREDAARAAEKAAEDAQKAADKAAEDAKRKSEQAQRDAEKALKEAEAAAKKRADLEKKINEQIADKTNEIRQAAFERESERLNSLASIRSGSVKINDLRSGGIDAFFSTLQEDPAIAEAKKSRQELEKILKQLYKLNAEKVDILAGVG